MYNDYPTIYESNINFNYIYIGIAVIIVLLIIILTFISLAKIFKKANRSGIYAWIPLYNIWILLEIVNKPKIYFILMLIPILNFIIYINIIFTLTQNFRKSEKFAIGIILLPFIFLPILAFSDNEYFGINLIAMEGKNTTANIPAVEIKKEQPKIEEHFEKDQNLHNINISIGGGVYQKNYTNNLLQVNEKQTISQKENNLTPKEQQPQINQNTINNNIERATTTTENKEEIITCPKCGSKLKTSATKCYLCGEVVS